MKKILLFILLSCSCFLVYSEDIVTGGKFVPSDAQDLTLKWTYSLRFKFVVNSNGMKHLATEYGRSAYKFNASAKYDENSKLLIRFKDNTMYEIPIDNRFPSSTEYSLRHTSGFVGSGTRWYYTYQIFTVPDDFFEKLQSGMPIIKIRVKLSNGENTDFEPKKSLTKQILESYDLAMKEVKERLDSADDKDF